MKITLIHPSRQRARRAEEAAQHWINLSDNKDNIQHILSLDMDDPELPIYRSLFHGSNYIISSNKNCVDAINHAAPEAKGDIIVVMSDDFRAFKGWDKAIIEALNGRTDCVLKTYDGIQPWIVTLPILGIDYYKAQGHVYFPKYQHMYCDTDMTHVADLKKKLIIRNDIVFSHEHYSTGKSNKDVVNERADSTWNAGEELYKRRVNERFGLGEVDVRNVTMPEGQAIISILDYWKI